MSGITHEQLVKYAVEAAENSYSPYSKFRVGAALLTADGQLFCGTNIENASYSLTTCAERSAFFAAVAAGYRKFSSIAIVASGDVPPAPCGACRQVMAEFCDGSFSVIIAAINNPQKLKVYKFDDLMPHRFDSESL